MTERHTIGMLGKRYWGRTDAELRKSLADLNRWAEANRESATKFERMGAPVEAAIMRNAAEEQTREFFRVEKMLEDLRKANAA